MHSLFWARFTSLALIVEGPASAYGHKRTCIDMTLPHKKTRRRTHHFRGAEPRDASSTCSKGVRTLAPQAGEVTVVISDDAPRKSALTCTPTSTFAAPSAVLYTFAVLPSVDGCYRPRRQYHTIEITTAERGAAQRSVARRHGPHNTHDSANAAFNAGGGDGLDSGPRKYLG